jgi:hypothetical protein
MRRNLLSTAKQRPLNPVPGLRRDIIATLEGAGLSVPAVTVAIVEDLPGQTSGKMKRVVPLS